MAKGSAVWRAAKKEKGRRRQASGPIHGSEL